MSDHNALTFIGWDDDGTATCEHPGCNWECAPTDITTQTEAFLAHHTNRHQDT